KRYRCWVGSPMSVPLLLERTLWLAGPLLQATISVFMLRRKLHRELPWFFGYTVFQVVQTTVSWFLHDKFPPYFYFYWSAELVGLILGLAVIYEVFRNVVMNYDRLHRAGFMLYRWCAVLLLLVATITVATAPNIDSAAIIEGIITLDRGVRLVQVGLLLFLFIFASYLSLSWRSHSFGVALGFGFLASVELALAAIRSHVGTDANQFYATLKPLTYFFTLLIW